MQIAKKSSCFVKQRKWKVIMNVKKEVEWKERREEMKLVLEVFMKIAKKH